MGFLYVFECMIRAIFAMYGGTTDVLKTTGEPATWTDVVVSICGWAVAGLIVAIVVLVIKRFTK